MESVDAFSRDLIEEAKRFFEKAKQATDSGQVANLHAALLLGFAALEAHVNAIADEVGTRDELQTIERGLLLEKDIRFQKGEFELSESLKMHRLEDRVSFIIRKFSGTAVDTSSDWWSFLREGIKLRNQLTHPKRVADFSEANVDRALRGVLLALEEMYQAVYRRPYPAGRRGLESSLDF